MSGLTPEHQHAARQAAAVVAQFIKASASDIDSLIRGYVDDLNSNFLDVLDGGMSAPAAVRDHQRMIDTLAEQAYDIGMTDGGADPADKDSEDEDTFNGWVVQQDAYIGGFWDGVRQLRKDRKDMTDEDYAAGQLTLNNRIGMWGDSLRNLYSLAKANAQKNMSVTWHFGDTDHCATCASLDGQRHRLKWFLDKGYIPQENGSDTLDCHGFNCQCTLENDDGDVIMP
jgi:hypothetical protein